MAIFNRRRNKVLDLTGSKNTITKKIISKNIKLRENKIKVKKRDLV